MKRLIPLLFLSLASPVSLFAEVENDIQWGVEAVTGYRSDYIYRGFQLSESTLDFQLETEVSLSDDLSLNLGGWYASETGSGNFEETAGFFKLYHQATKNLTLGVAANYRTYQESFLKNGADLGVNATWHFNDDLGIIVGAYYDTGARGWYGHVESNWSKELGNKAFFSFQLGISAVDDFYARNGMNDVYGRASITYNISETVSVTPFIGGTALLDNIDMHAGSKGYGGIWFEVRF